MLANIISAHRMLMMGDLVLLVLDFCSPDDETDDVQSECNHRAAHELAGCFIIEE